MNTRVSIQHHDYPSRVRETVEEKLQQLVDHSRRIVSMRARLERQRDQHRVEIVAIVAHGPTLVVDARAEVFRGALDEALDRMARALKRAREKSREGRRRAGRAEL